MSPVQRSGVLALKYYATESFSMPGVQEPPKQAMLDFEASGTAPKRQALVVMTYPPASNPIELEVDIDNGAVISHELVSWPNRC